MTLIAPGLEQIGYHGGPIMRGRLSACKALIQRLGLEVIHYEGSLMGGPDDAGTPDDFRRAWLTRGGMLEIDGASWGLYVPAEVCEGVA